MPHTSSAVAAVPSQGRRRGWRSIPAPKLSLVLPLAAVAALVPLLSTAERWQLDYALLVSQPWLALTGHLAHWSTEHLAWDLVVFTGLGLACEADGRRRTAAALLLAVAAIAFGLPLLAPEIHLYRGLSGLAAGLFALLATRCLRRPDAAARWAGAAALLALLAKVAWEATTGVPLFVGDTGGVAVVPAAHLLGALAGAAAGWPEGRPTAPAPGSDPG